MKLTDLSDNDLIARLRDSLIDEQEWMASHLLDLAELDRRKLFRHCASLKAFLVEEFGMDESRAERRVRAARMVKRFPEIHAKLSNGKLNISLLEIAQGCAHREKLEDSELLELLDAISGMSYRAARREIACRYPETAELPKDRIRPLTAEMSEVRFVATEELLEKLEEIRGLLAHSHPRLSLGELIDHLATDYRERHHPEEKARRAKERAEKKGKETEAVKTPATPLLEPNAQRSTPEKRTFSMPMVHAMTNRDGYRCRYEDPVTGKRCKSTFQLEKDHFTPWALGGKTEAVNARYLCAQHHRRVSFLQFGESSQYFKPK